MNLRNGQITVGEVLQNPEARVLLQRQVPQLAGLMNSPMARRFGNMPLSAALVQARRYLPENRIQSLLNSLSNL